VSTFTPRGTQTRTMHLEMHDSLYSTIEGGFWAKQQEDMKSQIT